jgi:hypothetical protein
MKTISCSVANHLLFVNFFEQCLKGHMRKLISQSKKTAVRKMVALAPATTS